MVNTLRFVCDFRRQIGVFFCELVPRVKGGTVLRAFHYDEVLLLFFCFCFDLICFVLFCFALLFLYFL
jgi:hypothetical protein